MTRGEAQSFFNYFNSGGYVLDFTTPDFDSFTLEHVGVPLVAKYGLSKAKSLRAFLLESSDALCVRLCDALFTYQKETNQIYDSEERNRLISILESKRQPSSPPAVHTSGSKPRKKNPGNQKLISSAARLLDLSKCRGAASTYARLHHLEESDSFFHPSIDDVIHTEDIARAKGLFCGLLKDVYSTADISDEQQFNLVQAEPDLKPYFEALGIALDRWGTAQASEELRRKSTARNVFLTAWRFVNFAVLGDYIPPPLPSGPEDEESEIDFLRQIAKNTSVSAQADQLRLNAGEAGVQTHATDDELRPCVPAFKYLHWVMFEGTQPIWDDKHRQIGSKPIACKTYKITAKKQWETVWKLIHAPGEGWAKLERGWQSNFSGDTRDGAKDFYNLVVPENRGQGGSGRYRLLP